MGAVDFSEWVAPDLELTLRGHTYPVCPPSGESAKMVLAAAVYAEVDLGLVEGEVPEEIQQILDGIGDSHPALGSVYDAMVADGHHQVNIDRVAYYAVFYWARGKGYADALAKLLWLPREIPSEGGGGAAPKG
jgi:hypothetical protein